MICPSTPACKQKEAPHPYTPRDAGLLYLFFEVGASIVFQHLLDFSICLLRQNACADVAVCHGGHPSKLSFVQMISVEHDKTPKFIEPIRPCIKSCGHTYGTSLFSFSHSSPHQLVRGAISYIDVTLSILVRSSMTCSIMRQFMPESSIRLAMAFACSYFSGYASIKAMYLLSPD